MQQEYCAEWNLSGQTIDLVGHISEMQLFLYIFLFYIQKLNFIKWVHCDLRATDPVNGRFLMLFLLINLFVAQ